MSEHVVEERRGWASEIVWVVVYSILVLLVMLLWVYVPALNTARCLEGQSGPRLRDGVRSALFPFRPKGSLEPTSGRHFGSPSRPFRQIRRWREHLLLSWRRSSRRRTDCLPQQPPVSQRPQPSH